MHYAQQLIHTFYGTPLYLSPEVCTKKGYSFASDMWSLGIILYEMCTLQPPFYEQNLISLAQSICNKEIPPITRPDDQFTDFFQKSFKSLLRKDPEKRPNASSYNNFVQLFLESLNINKKVFIIESKKNNEIDVVNSNNFMENINTNPVVLGKSRSMTIVTRPKTSRIIPSSISIDAVTTIKNSNVNSLPIQNFASSPPVSNNLSSTKMQDNKSNYNKIGKAREDIKSKLFKPLNTSLKKEEFDIKAENVDPAVMQALKRQNAILQNLLVIIIFDFFIFILGLIKLET